MRAYIASNMEDDDLFEDFLIENNISFTLDYQDKDTDKRHPFYIVNDKDAFFIELRMRCTPMIDNDDEAYRIGARFVYFRNEE